jgi:hypothetical protein
MFFAIFFNLLLQVFPLNAAQVNPAIQTDEPQETKQEIAPQNGVKITQIDVIG